MVNLRLLHRKTKLFLMILVVVISLILTGCNKTEDNIKEDIKNIEEDKGKIVKAQLSDMEKNLIGASGVNRYLVADVIFENENYKNMDIWVDHYVEGKLEGKISGININLKNFSKEFSRIMLVTIEGEQESEKDTWILSSISGSGYSSIKMSLDKSKIENMAATWGVVEDIPIEKDKEINMGFIILDSGVIRASSEILTNKSIMNGHIQKYDEVYILRCRIN